MNSIFKTSIFLIARNDVKMGTGDDVSEGNNGVLHSSVQ